MTQQPSRRELFDEASAAYLERLKSSSPSKRLLESIAEVEADRAPERVRTHQRDAVRGLRGHVASADGGDLRR